MKLHFTKMHGIGNDYVCINCFEQQVAEPEALAAFVSHRHFGIGSDGLVLILPSQQADFRMRMFNADGLESQMCGNAIRCVGKYVYDNRMTDKTTLTIETLSGIKQLDLSVAGGLVQQAEVDMGKAILEAERIPVKTEQEVFLDQPVMVGGKAYNLTCVSMGNPHAVTFIDDIDSLNLAEIGPDFEHHPFFPERINTEFVQVMDHNTLKVRIWERGSGETMACGTGACAAAVVAVLKGICGYNRPITLQLRGGRLTVTYQKDGTVMMKGEAAKVFDGVIEIPQ